MACQAKSTEPIAPIQPPTITAVLVENENPWSIDLPNSKIKFEALEKGKSIQGQFERFELDVDLDLNNPDKGRILAEIDVTSVNAGSSDRNQVLRDTEMFFIQKFPVARFQSDNISRISEGQYKAKGELSLKGLTKNIVLPFSITQNGKNAVVIAKYEMNRLDFNIGSGSFLSDKYVGYPVTITIEIKARKANVQESLQ